MLAPALRKLTVLKKLNLSSKWPFQPQPHRVHPLQKTHHSGHGSDPLRRTDRPPPLLEPANNLGAKGIAALIPGLQQLTRLKSLVLSSKCVIDRELVMGHSMRRGLHGQYPATICWWCSLVWACIPLSDYFGLFGMSEYIRAIAVRWPI